MTIQIVSPAAKRSFSVVSTAERDLLVGLQDGDECFVVNATNVVESAWVFHNGGWRAQPPAGAHGNLGAHTEPGAVLNLRDGVAPAVSGDGGPLPAFPTARTRNNHRRSSLIGWDVVDDDTNDRNDIRAFFGASLARGGGFWARQSGGLGTSATLVNDSLRYHPFDVAVGGAIDRLGFGITAMGTSTVGSIRLAVHRSNPETGAPLTNGLVAGTDVTVPFASLSAAFIQAVVAATLPAGRLWMCLVPQGFDGTLPTFATLTNTQDGILTTSVPPAAGNNHTGYSETIGAGAVIPATLAGLILGTTPLISVRTA